MKQFENPSPFLKEAPPISTNPLFLSNFFMTPLFVQFSKTIPPPPHLKFWGEETMRFIHIYATPTVLVVVRTLVLSSKIY